MNSSQYQVSEDDALTPGRINSRKYQGTVDGASSYRTHGSIKSMLMIHELLEISSQRR